MAGLGRSGWAIHIRTLKHMTDRFSLVAVLDGQPERRKEAAEALGCAAYTSYPRMLRESGAELVVVAMPTDLHSAWAIKGLKAGKHVVVEKPVGRNLRETDRVIAAEKETGLSATVFQNRRFEPEFRQVREVIASGQLGRVNFIRACAAQFTRRWDWQTVKELGGGMLRNHGVHLLDMLMEFAGPGEPELFCKMDRMLCAGDAEDWVQLVLKAQDWPTLEVDVFMNSAYPLPRWLALGQKGSLIADGAGLRWKTVRGFDALPEMRLDLGPAAERKYSTEKLEFDEFTWTKPAAPEGLHGAPDVRAFYDGLYAHLRTGAPQPVTLEGIRRRMKIIDTCLRKYGV